jgi:hypothetical protein
VVTVLWVLVGKVNVTRASNSAAFQARGPDFTRLAGLALSGLQNDTLLLTDVVLPASKLDLKREQAQINALNARLSASQQVPTATTTWQFPLYTAPGTKCKRLQSLACRLPCVVPESAAHLQQSAT